MLSVQESQVVNTRRVLGCNHPRLALVVVDDEHPTAVITDLARRGSCPEGLAFPYRHRSRFFLWRRHEGIISQTPEPG